MATCDHSAPASVSDGSIHMEETAHENSISDSNVRLSPAPPDHGDPPGQSTDRDAVSLSDRVANGELPNPLRENHNDEDSKLLNPPEFPQLSDHPSISPDKSQADDDAMDASEEPNVDQIFDRVPPVDPATLRSLGSDYDESGEESVARMHKYSLYETATRYYLVGMDILDKRFRILKIDRTSESGDLIVAEDDIVYTKEQMNQLLDTVDDGNKSSGGLKLKCSTWGLLGFIRLTGAYYMLVITKRSQVAMIGGHYIYQVDGTELVPLTMSASAHLRPDKNPEEAKYINILNYLDLTRSFYFSYSYDITRTLQDNLSHEREALQKGLAHSPNFKYNSMFVWNDYLLQPAISALKNSFDWCLPIIHGHVDQSTLSVYGRVVYITIIARRSRYYAGARYLKRGSNDLGYVANDVETEQIVSEMLTTSFHAPGPKLYGNSRYTSYVQHRGSIPLYWTQDSTSVTPKPDIEIHLVDPFYSAAALHFDNLFERYGAPVYVVNLVKARERTPRESKLLVEYTRAIQYLNQFLPDDKKILYKAWDMSRASKSRDQDVIDTLETLAADIIPRTGFFRNGVDEDSGLAMQNGVVRTNCIDCLDRTNAAQFVIGKRALGHQLHALGIIDGTSVEYDTDAVNLFTNMWHDHGDTIAIQYGGSHLVNTMATYRKINQWSSHSRDMVESFKRYYNNSFLDAQRQEAYNLFLGNYAFSPNDPMLWELATDYYLHHTHPRAQTPCRERRYINWYNPEFLKERKMGSTVFPTPLGKKPLGYFDDYWLEYYRPLTLTSFSKLFAFKMNSSLRYLPLRATEAGRYDLSPFVVRSSYERENREAGTPRRKGVTIQEPDELGEEAKTTTSRNESMRISKPIETWLQQPPSSTKPPPSNGIIKTPQFEVSSHVPSRNEIPPMNISTDKNAEPSKAQITQWTLNQLVNESLNPSVSATEAEEYERYINHPLKVPLVVTSEDALTFASMRERSSNLDLLEYANKITLEDTNLDMTAEESIPDYMEFLSINQDGLTVNSEDYNKKRYKRYRQWLRGKSLFKQLVDP